MVEDTRGNQLPHHNYIRNTSTCGTTPTEHLLNAGKDLRLPKRYFFISFFSSCECISVCFFV